MDFSERDRLFSTRRDEREGELERLRQERDRLREELRDTRVRFRKFTRVSGEFASAMRGRMSERRRLELQHTVLGALEPATADEVPRKFLEILGQELEPCLCVFWMAHENALRCAETWQSSGTICDALEDACRSSDFSYGSGLPGRAWAEARPVRVENLGEVPSDPRLEAAAREDLRGAVAFPIRNSSRLIGVAEFFGQKIQAPDEGLIRTLTILGNQVAQVIGHKRAEEALRESELRLAADLAGMRRLYDLHAKLANETDLKAALDEILAAACEFSGTPRGCIQLVSDDGERLEMFAWRGYADDNPFIEHFRYEGSKPACDQARKHRQRLVIEDIENFEPLAGTKDREIALAENIRATQSTPLLGRAGEMVGVLNTQFDKPHSLSDEESKLIDLLAWTAADFVERHRADAALRENEERLRLAQRAARSGTWEWDLQSDEIRWSEEHRELFGFDPECPITRELWWEAVHPDDVARLEEAGRRCREEGAEWPETEYRITRQDTGERRWINARGRTIRDAAGQPVRILGISVDITERKKADEERERLRALEVTARAQAAERERLSRDLHDRVAHEMGIVHQSLQLYEAISPTDPERAAEKIEVAKRMAKSALESTRNLSAELRRSEAEESLEEALREYVEAVAPQDVELAFSFDGDESPVVSHTRGQLYLILCEAIRNSVKHSRCRTMNVSVEILPTGVSASVQDDGLGFEVDGRVDEGVGLRSMRERVELLGGELRFTSTPESGTKVGIIVPLGEEPS